MQGRTSHLDRGGFPQSSAPPSPCHAICVQGCVHWMPYPRSPSLGISLSLSLALASLHLSRSLFCVNLFTLLSLCRPPPSSLSLSPLPITLYILSLALSQSPFSTPSARTYTHYMSHTHTHTHTHVHTRTRLHTGLFLSLPPPPSPPPPPRYSASFLMHGCPGRSREMSVRCLPWLRESGSRGSRHQWARSDVGPLSLSGGALRITWLYLSSGHTLSTPHSPPLTYTAAAANHLVEALACGGQHLSPVVRCAAY